MRKLIFLFVVMITMWESARGQITTVSDGAWNNPLTWSCNCIPTFSSGTISIDHSVTIPSGFSVTIDQTTVNAVGVIDIQSSGTLTLRNTTNALVVTGQVIAREGSVFSSPGSSTLRFDSGSVYRHLFTVTQGTIPLAVWNIASTLSIEGYTSFTTAATSGNWSQTFGNVVWNTTAQTAPTLNLNGLLRTVAGDFTINSTNGQVLQLVSNQRITINVTGNFIVQGNSRVNVNSIANVAGAILNVGGDFIFNSAAASTSFLTNTGNTTVNISGDFDMNAPGSTLYLTSAANNTSIGALNIMGDFTLTAGTITEGLNDAFASRGRIFFVNDGEGTTHTFSNLGSITNRIEYQLSASSDTLHILGESQIIGNASSSFALNGGVLIVESTSASGAIITGFGAGSGNIRTATRTYTTGSRVVYGATAPQVVGYGHVSTMSIIIDNPTTVNINVINATTVETEGLTILQGTVTLTNTNLTVAGNLSISAGTLNMNALSTVRTITVNNNLVSTGGTINLTGSSNNISLTVNGDVSFSGGTLNITNTTDPGTFTIAGDIIASGGSININSGTANITTTTQGNFSGTDLFVFSGNNNNLTITGTGTPDRSFPFNGATTIENITINRPSATIAVDVPLAITNNFTVEAGRADINETATVEGDLEVATGSVIHFEDGTLTLEQQFNSVLSGGLLSANGSSILNLLGAGTVGTLAFDASGNTLGRLTLNRSTGGTLVTLNSALTIADSLVLTDGVFQNTSGLNFNNNALLSRNAAASFSGVTPTGGPYDLVYDGTSLATGTEATGAINDITINSSGTVTMSAILSATGELRVNSGVISAGVFDLSVGSILNEGTISAPSSILSVSGNWVNNGMFNHNAGTVRFTGNTALSGSFSVVAYNVEITGTFTSAPLFIIQQDLLNNGILDPNGGQIRFSGASLQTVSGTATSDFHHIDVTNTTLPVALTFDASANLTGELTLSSSSIVDVDGSANTAVFTLRSTNDTPTADGTIATLSGTASVIGNVTVQRYMRAEVNVNRYVSTPVATTSIASFQDDLTASQNSMKWFNEQRINFQSSKRWTELSSESASFVIGRGYSCWMYNNIPVTWDVSGNINSGTINLPVTRSNSTPAIPSADGWNLLGNPYPSSIVWDDGAGWSRTNIATTVYVPDEAPGGWRMYNYSDLSGDLPNGIIATGQAFWVYADNSPNLEINENAKVSSGNGNFYREKKSLKPLSKTMVISLSHGKMIDRAYFKMNQDATPDFDWSFDAFKLMNDHLNISVQDDHGRRMGMHTLAEVEEGTIIPLHVTASTAGSYAINIDTEHFDHKDDFVFYDRVESALMNVTDVENYSFVISEGHLELEDRFFIVKGNVNSRFPEFTSVSLFPNPATSEVQVSLLTHEAARVTVLDSKGRKLMEKDFEKGTKLDVSSFPVGIYFVKIIHEGHTITRRLLKK